MRRWSSICRGATLWGLEHSELTSVISRPTVISRISRYSYGLRFSHLFNPKEHLLEDKYLDVADGKYRADNQMTWLLKRVRPLGLHKAFSDAHSCTGRRNRRWRRIEYSVRTRDG